MKYLYSATIFLQDTEVKLPMSEPVRDNTQNGKPRTEQIVFLILIAGWTLLACGLAVEAIWRINQRFDQRNEAEISAFLARDYALRHWILENGGVYVRESVKVPQNKYLSQVTEAAVTTTKGKRLVLVNGAYAMRLLTEQYKVNNPEEIYVHATSMNPFRSTSAPDQWERASLRQMEANTTDKITGREIHDGKTTLRSMVPLYAKQNCLECHGSKGFKLGDLIGGLSISLPLDKKLQRKQQQINRNLVQFGAIWLVGLMALLVARYELRKRSRARDVAEMGLKKAFDEMEQRVLERTAELTETAQKLQSMALTDSLTSLNNRRYFLELLEAECKRSARHGNALSLLMIDLDHFKQINDEFGHPMGDKALKAFAQTLREVIRAEDQAGRLGGEEFGVILPETAIDQALVLAERIRTAVVAINLPGQASRIKLTASIGAAQMQRRTETTENLLKRADEMLYLAKNKGRNRIEPSAGQLA